MNESLVSDPGVGVGYLPHRSLKNDRELGIRPQGWGRILHRSLKNE
jgi:hypothetical protein